MSELYDLINSLVEGFEGSPNEFLLVLPRLGLGLADFRKGLVVDQSLTKVIKAIHTQRYATMLGLMRFEMELAV